MWAGSFLCFLAGETFVIEGMWSLRKKTSSWFQETMIYPSAWFGARLEFACHLGTLRVSKAPPFFPAFLLLHLGKVLQVEVAAT